MHNLALTWDNSLEQQHTEIRLIRPMQEYECWILLHIMVSMVDTLPSACKSVAVEEKTAAI